MVPIPVFLAFAISLLVRLLKSFTQLAPGSSGFAHNGKILYEKGGFN